MTPLRVAVECSKMLRPARPLYKLLLCWCRPLSASLVVETLSHPMSSVVVETFRQRDPGLPHLHPVVKHPLRSSKPHAYCSTSCWIFIHFPFQFAWRVSMLLIQVKDHHQRFTQGLRRPSPDYAIFLVWNLGWPIIVLSSQIYSSAGSHNYHKSLVPALVPCLEDYE